MPPNFIKWLYKFRPIKWSNLSNFEIKFPQENRLKRDAKGVNNAIKYFSPTTTTIALTMVSYSD